MAMAKIRDLLVSQVHAEGAVINDDEVVARAVHFDKGKAVHKTT
jgi:hypothetical protein